MTTPIYTTTVWNEYEGINLVYAGFSIDEAKDAAVKRIAQNAEISQWDDGSEQTVFSGKATYIWKEHEVVE